MVGNERTGRCSAGNRLENGSVDLHVTVFVEEVAHGVEHFGALDENVAHAFVDHEVYVAAAIAQFWVVE